jgi:hypothetical protein
MGDSMFGSVILDVAIGMVYIYLLLSLVASVVNEALASLVQSRAANLQRGLRSLLSGDSIEASPADGDANAITLVDNIYNHGLIRGLYQDPAKDYGGKVLSLWSGFRLKLQRWVGIAPAKPIAGVSDQLLLPSYIPARAFALAMIDILNKDKFNGKTPIENIEDFLSAHHQQFQKNKAVEALLTLVIDAKNDAEKDAKKLQNLQTNLENWYNDAMDRVSGWYKRYTQNVLMIIGLVLAIAFNVSSVRIAHTLWVDRDARQGMVNAANDYLQNHKDVSMTGSLADQMKSSVKAVNEVSAEFLLPLGWRYSWTEYECWWKQYPYKMAGDALVILVGWLITAGALSLGASFWFDMLNKIMVVRNTVKPQEKSPIEGSKDN